jgi:outer membrane protein
MLPRVVTVTSLSAAVAWAASSGLVAWLGVDLHAQTVPTMRLTLTQAKDRARANHPKIASAELVSEALEETVSAARSAYFPTFSANVTTVRTQPSSAIAAGALSTSSLADRFAGGLVASQLLTDFGRTRSLTATAALNATIQDRRVDEIRASVVMDVANAYYEALAADAILTVARADLDAKRLLLRQVSALAQSELKSTLDVSFADVAVSEGELRVERAQAEVQAARARLSAALGDTVPAEYELVDEEIPPPLESDPRRDIDEATRNRPELSASRLRREAAEQFATAEGRLNFPSVMLLGVAGALPTHDERLKGSYGAVGINVSIPVWNGRLFASRHAEAERRLAATSKDLNDLTLGITRDVRIAWLTAASAFKVIDVTTRLVQRADTTVRLATARYDVGLSSIIEVTQAQLSQTSARIEAAKAKYEYLQRRAGLDYAVGRLR